GGGLCAETHALHVAMPHPVRFRREQGRKGLGTTCALHWSTSNTAEETMSNVIVRKENEKSLAPSWESRWEPFRMMRDLLGWDPFREMATFVAHGPAMFAPSFEIKETKENYVFKADVPGVKESDLEITLTGNRLTISGKREAERKEQNETYYAYERS